jgi:hypothetical protein
MEILVREIDYLTCRNLLPLQSQKKRRSGRTCGTLVPLVAGISLPVICPSCKARVM